MDTPVVELRPIPIKRFYGYFAGSDGNIYSGFGRGWKQGMPLLENPRLRPSRPSTRGVLIVTLKNGKSFSVCRLVCLTFHGPCPEEHECSHLDGDCTNNKPHNLRWETKKQNAQRKKEHGTEIYGLRNGNGRFTEQEIEEAKELCKQGLSQRSVSRQFGMSEGYLSQIINGQRRKGEQSWEA